VERSCKIIKDITNIEFNLERGLLNSTKVCFKKKMQRGVREKLEKCLQKEKYRVVWGKQCALVRKVKPKLTPKSI